MHISSSFYEVEDELNHDIVIIAEDFGDTASDPPESKSKIRTACLGNLEHWGRTGLNQLLDDLNIDFLHVNLLIEFGRELGRLHEPRIAAGGHGERGGPRRSGGFEGSRKRLLRVGKGENLE